MKTKTLISISALFASSIAFAAGSATYDSTVDGSEAEAEATLLEQTLDNSNYILVATDDTTTDTTGYTKYETDTITKYLVDSDTGAVTAAEYYIYYKEEITTATTISANTSETVTGLYVGVSGTPVTVDSGVTVDKMEIEGIGNVTVNGSAISVSGTVGTVTDSSEETTPSLSDEYNSSYTYSGISGDFFDNGNTGNGGAIYNSKTGVISAIEGNFYGNSAGYGGAIYTYGTIFEIKADFNNNSASNNGGAIFTHDGSKIYYIEGNFYYNSAASGGAIAVHTSGTIDTIANSLFYGNSATSGGAIYTKASGSSIYNITNSTFEANTATNGGAIYNIGTISYMSNTSFDTNNAESGAAIYNTGTIGTAVDSEGNTVTDTTYNADYTYTGISDSTFTSNSSASAGAIYNSSTIYAIDADFDSNKATGTVGGAIRNTNTGSIYYITGNFTSNSAVTYGGAIYTNKYIGTIDDSTFTGNYVSGTSAVAGGAIYNNSSIEYIGADFTGNYTTTTAATLNSQGGAIYNANTITEIVGNFKGNYVTNTGGNNNGQTQGGAIYNASTIGSSTSGIGITGDFIGNSANEGTLGNSDGGTDVSGGAIYNSGYIYGIDGNFISNFTYSAVATRDSYGGAIYNSGTIYNLSGSFIGNYAYNKADTYLQGGAIYNTKAGTIYFTTSGEDTQFTGNYISNSGTTTSNFAYNLGTLNFDASGSNSITVNDEINGSSGIININANGGTSTVVFNNTITDQTITVSAGTLELGSYAGTNNIYEDYYSSDEYDSNEYDSFSAYITATYGTLAVDSSTASLSSSTITVASGATLQISARGVSTDSSITLESGSTLYMSASSSLTASSIAISADGDFYVVFDFAGNATINDNDVYSFLTDNDGYIESVLGIDMENVSIEEGLADAFSDLAEGEEYTLVLSGTYDSTDGYSNITLSTAPVPEPSTYAMILGALALGFAYYRRRK